MPNELTLRRTYTSDSTEDKSEIKHGPVFVFIDEAIDKEFRLVGNIVIVLLGKYYPKLTCRPWSHGMLPKKP